MTSPLKTTSRRDEYREWRRNQGVAKLAKAVLDPTPKTPKSKEKISRLYLKMQSKWWHDPTRPLEDDVAGVIAAYRHLEQLAGKNHAPNATAATTVLNATVDAANTTASAR